VLHFLAVEDDQAAVAWLRARGADINTKNEFGTPVLFEVASLGYKALFSWLIEAGADPHAEDADADADADADGQSLTEHLLEYNHVEMADWVRTQISKL
jgi:ankyrin repeat protein